MSQQVIVMTEQQLTDFAKNLLDAYSLNVSKEVSPPAEILTPEQLRTRLGIGVSTEIRYRKKGKLPWLQIGDVIRYNWIEVLKKITK